MRIVQINTTYNLGSTGKIMKDIGDIITESGHESYMLCAYSKEKKSNLYIMKSFFKYPFNDYINTLIPRLTGRNGYSRKKSTRKAIEWLSKIKPDVIHLHNIHGNWINLELFFKYIRNSGAKIVWTFHDCWPFTGRCSHFELCGCYKWKIKCGHCHNKHVFPYSYFFDFSKRMLADKKKYYGDLSDIKIVTPSSWLGRYVKESFLCKNKVYVIHNGIDTSIYRKSNNNPFIKFGNKKVLLGVSNTWSNTKGLGDFMKLNEIIDHNKYQIVLVGLNDKQLKMIPKNIYGVKRTTNQKELVDFYSFAHAYINPTYQDNYPTTNLEAQSCGTLCYTYRTGGSPESVNPNFVFEKGNIEGIYRAIDDKMIAFQKPFVEFDKRILFKEYIDIYLE